MYSRFLISLLWVLGSLALSGCQSLQSSDHFLGVVTPYKLEVLQGNVVTQEQAAAVQPGMSRAQVRDILGSPLLTDLFHANRWDYVFTIRRQGAPHQQRRVVAWFDGEVLKKLETGGDLPAEREFAASIDNNKPARSTPKLALTEEQLKALPTPPEAAADETSAASSAAPRTYPPLGGKP
jgi:outer membrane protein assembly factor BamE